MKLTAGEIKSEIKVLDKRIKDFENKITVCQVEKRLLQEKLLKKLKAK